MPFVLSSPLFVNTCISFHLDASSTSANAKHDGQHDGKELTKKDILMLCKKTMVAQTVNHKYNKFNATVNEFVMIRMKDQVDTSCFYKILVQVATSGD